MVESKLTITKTINPLTEQNPFYGRSMYKVVQEKSFISERDDREDIAPFGVIFEFNDDKFSTISNYIVKADKGILVWEDNKTYTFSFVIDDESFEANITFDEKGITDIWVEQWYDTASFMDGNDSDCIIEFDKIKAFAKLEG